MTVRETIAEQRIYVGRAFTDDLRVASHVAFVPFVEGLHALCGAVLMDTRPTTIGQVLERIPCAECRTRVSDAQGPPTWRARG